jgi:hypothetical protein
VCDFKVIAWTEQLNLKAFYQEADCRGFSNNSSERMLVDCFRNEREKQTWILYYKGEAIGSAAAHSFDDVMGPGSYRIAARTCVFTDKLKGLVYSNGLRGISVITRHQNPTAQFLIPTCIDWAPEDAKLYITSNELEAGTQQRVHNIFGPALQRTGVMEPVKSVNYRGTDQTVWRFDQDLFLEQLDFAGRW